MIVVVRTLPSLLIIHGMVVKNYMPSIPSLVFVRSDRTTVTSNPYPIVSLRRIAVEVIAELMDVYPTW